MPDGNAELNHYSSPQSEVNESAKPTSTAWRLCALGSATLVGFSAWRLLEHGLGVSPTAATVFAMVSGFALLVLFVAGAPRAAKDAFQVFLLLVTAIGFAVLAEQRYQRRMKANQEAQRIADRLRQEQAPEKPQPE